MVKFVLCDPSIAGTGGHYLEYAVRVLEAARIQGFDPYLAVNAAFDGTVPDIPVVKPFRYDIWGEVPTRKKRPLGPRTAMDVKLLKYYKSRFASLWAAAKDPAALEHYNRHTGGAGVNWRWISRMVGVRSQVASRLVEDRLSGKLDELNDGEMLVHEAYIAAALCLKSKRPDVPVFEKSNALLSMGLKNVCANQFASALKFVVEEFALSEEDYIFLPTMSWTDLRGLQQFRRLQDRSPELHLLFRRNIFREYADKWQGQGFDVHELSHLFSQVAVCNADKKVFCYTDTVPLTAQYEELGSGPFIPLPIPAPEVRSPRRKSGQPIRIAYLGDARTEKGFQYLPALVRAVRDSLWRSRVVFDVQCYLPEGHSPVDMLQTIESLKRLQGPHLELHFGALSADGYSKAIERSDAILIAYDRGNYSARSSGIFIEALCSGRPVIATGGTWMSALADMLSDIRFDELISKHVGAAPIPGARLKWQTVQGEPFVGAPSQKSKRLTLSNREVACTILRVPSRATHLVLRFKNESPISGTYLDLHCVSRGENGNCLSEDVRAVGGHEADRIGTLFKVLPGQVDFWLGIGNARGATKSVMSDIEFVWVESNQPLEASVGGIYVNPDVPGGYEAGLIKAVFVLEQDYPAYAQSAAFARSILGGVHHADRLVQDILQASQAKAALTTNKYVTGFRDDY
ncbi:MULTISPECIES: glycosyltransferase [Asticcacaulis]|uniref:glycosyltransferase n=1 Tax=Asticcacaulis TaxID=76890 RepID=UPI001AEB5CD7|nr:MULTISPECIES: glycosyltransferase [Asticcacaulis]MBP2161881.1 hypothetical protein [Asticcacaulis solisilvae]MDR6802928.1 hypothetical protein [Asticcacaulis sp. BE141]